jgi:predicted DNA repair protein MutK
MAGGFWMLLDDVAAFAKLAAVSAARSGAKTAGVVVDDAFEASAKLTGSHGENSAPADESVIVRKAFRTDLVLSAEIMAISLAEVSHEPLAVQAARTHYCRGGDDRRGVRCGCLCREGR